MSDNEKTENPDELETTIDEQPEIVTDDKPVEDADTTDNVSPESDADDDNNDTAEDDEVIVDSDEDDFSDSEVSTFTEVTDSEHAENATELEQVNEEKKTIDYKKILKKAIKPAAIVLGSLFVISLAVYIVGIMTLPKDRVMNNLYVEDIDVSGLTYDETLAKLNTAYLLENQKIIITCSGKNFVINGNDIGMAANPEDTAKKAYGYGKSGNVLADGFKNALNLVKKKVIIPVAGIDRDLLTQKINEFGVEIYGEMIGHYVEINETDQTATIWPGHTGYNPNDEASYTAACDTVLESIKNDNYKNIRVPLSASAPPDISVETFDSLVYADPVNAQYAVEGNTVNIVPEQTGRYINKEEAAAMLPEVHEGGEVVKIPYYLSYADVTADILSEKLFSATLSSYSTNYGGSTSNRKGNVARAASLINGTVIAPGEIFSFNDTVGDRTVSNGFYSATEYVNGESVQGIGGGTCQVSTTLYSAVLYADMQIVSRENHVMTVGYVPLGQDATVAYNSVDFKFKNTSDYPIKISTYADGGTIGVSIIGTAWEPERTVEIKHSTSYVGEDTSVVSTRYVYSNGELISTDPLGVSYYKPHKSSSTTTTQTSSQAASSQSSYEEEEYQDTDDESEE